MLFSALVVVSSWTVKIEFTINEKKYALHIFKDCEKCVQPLTLRSMWVMTVSVDVLKQGSQTDPWRAVWNQTCRVWFQSCKNTFHGSVWDPCPKECAERNNFETSESSSCILCWISAEKVIQMYLKLGIPPLTNLICIFKQIRFMLLITSQEPVLSAKGQHGKAPIFDCYPSFLPIWILLQVVSPQEVILKWKMVDCLL